MRSRNFCRFIISNTTSLRIPNKFTRDHRKHILLNKVVLIVSDDIFWDLSLTVSSDGKLWLQKGWPEFAKRYGLKFGYMLLFDHVGESVFNVRIFDLTSCEINYSQDGDDNHVIAGNMGPATPTVGHGLDGAGAGAGVGAGGDGKEQEVPASDDSVKNVKKSMSKIVRKTYIRYIPLTKVFEKATGISCYDTLLLKNKEGRKWKVDIKRYNQKQQLVFITKGWSKFMKDNKVEVGDKCDFKHVKGKLIRVHVFKKKARPPGKKSNCD